MLHAKFHQISPAVPEKTILKCFNHIWAWQPSWSCDQHYVDEFSFPWPYKLTFKIWLVTDKTSSIFYVNDLTPWSRNDLDLQYPHIFINSISFRSQAAIITNLFSLLPIEKPKLQNLTLP